MLFNPFQESEGRKLAEQYFATRDFSYFPQDLNINDLRYLMSSYIIELAGIDFKNHVHFNLPKNQSESDYLIQAVSDVSRGAYEIEDFPVSYVDLRISAKPNSDFG